MSLWTDKYRPQDIEDLPIDNITKKKLDKLAHSEDVPHMLVHGPPGSGKTSCIRAVLRKLYDANVTKLKIDERAFQSPSGRKVEVTIYSSNYHVELNPSDAGIFDRVVIQEVIKEFAQTQQLERTKKQFKTAVIFDADLLSKDAQHALRRTMEKFCANVRLILCCESSSRIIAPIKSRCFILRLNCPSSKTIKRIIESTISIEKKTLSDCAIETICVESDGNLRSALLAAEALCSTSMKESVDMRKYFQDIASSLLRDRSITCILSLRQKLYDLLSRGFSQHHILQGLLLEFSSNPAFLGKIGTLLEYSSLFDHRMSNSAKPILHLEAFIAMVLHTVVQN